MTLFIGNSLADYRSRRAKDIAETVVLLGSWNMSHHGRIVFLCPRCGQKIGADLDLSEGPQDRMLTECENCGAEIRLALRWRIDPELIGVQFFATTPQHPQPAEEQPA